ncbi:MAG: hypothetical protein F4Y28_13680 [Acidimicrobiia bacterium]|nr:hypothetical protein [Acidimicrobiia bacterium]MYG58495.1 hypothetical protein [Acidimicrobiia bacterium]MYJ33745.1 hypothetical protein [Acidimicrobiia bacterium]
MLLAVLGVFAVVAAACGNDDDDAPAPSVDDGAEEPSEEFEMTAAEAAARIAPLFQVPASIHATEPLASLPKGAKLAYVAIGALAKEAKSTISSSRLSWPIDDS